MYEKENPDHIDLNDARVYLIKFMETHNYEAMRKLFNDLTETVSFEMWKWVMMHSPPTMDSIIKAFRIHEWHEDAEKLSVIKEQIQLVKHGTKNEA